MSFKTKQPAPPPVPAAPTAPETLPTTGRKLRLSSQGRQSTFLGSLGAAALAGPKPSLTGI